MYRWRQANAQQKKTTAQATTQTNGISRSDDTVLDVASAIQRLQAHERTCEQSYQVECARVITRASQSTEPNGIRTAMYWQWKAQRARETITQLRGSYDKNASDAVYMVLKAEPTAAMIERMLEHLPRRFAEGCRVKDGGMWIQDPRLLPREYPKINEEGPRHTATIGTGGKRYLSPDATYKLTAERIESEPELGAYCYASDIEVVREHAIAGMVLTYCPINGLFMGGKRVGTVTKAHHLVLAAAVRVASAFLSGHRGAVQDARDLSRDPIGHVFA